MFNKLHSLTMLYKLISFKLYCFPKNILRNFRKVCGVIKAFGPEQRVYVNKMMNKSSKTYKSRINRDLERSGLSVFDGAPRPQ